MSDKNEKRGFLLLNDGDPSEWMIVSDYCDKMLAKHNKKMTVQAIYYRCKPRVGILETKIQHGVRLVREKKLKEGTRVYDRYFRTHTCP